MLSTHGVPLGGDLLDSRVVETQVAPLFGEDARYRSTGLPLPRNLFTSLRTWQSIVELSKPRPFELIRRARLDCDQPAQLAALEALVAKNYGLALFQAVEAAKIELSHRGATTVRLAIDAQELQREVPRPTFEAVVRPQVDQAKECVLETLRRANVEPGRIDLVLTTGGSSSIPVFRRMLREALPNADLEESSAFTSVAMGLALPV